MHCFVLGVFEETAKSDYQFRCVCPHVATRLPVQGYSFNPYASNVIYIYIYVYIYIYIWSAYS